LSRTDRLNLIARRQLDSLGAGHSLRYVAERMEILNSAKSWVDENTEDYDIMDVLAVAEYLAGDRAGGTE
jgi:hypothetical protein